MYVKVPCCLYLQFLFKLVYFATYVITYHLHLQVNLTIEEHTRDLLALNRKFGITLLDAVTLLQESDLFLESVKVGKKT